VSPSDIGKTDLQTLCFIAYEQLGFNGIGPGRFALRQGGVHALKPWVPLLGIYAIAVCIVLLAAMSTFLQPRLRKRTLLTALALGFPAAFIIAMGFSTKFRVLGRHFTPLVCVVILLYSVGAANLWRARAWWLRPALALFLFLSAFSCFAERFTSRHA